VTCDGSAKANCPGPDPLRGIRDGSSGAAARSAVVMKGFSAALRHTTQHSDAPGAAAARSRTLTVQLPPTAGAPAAAASTDAPVPDDDRGDDASAGGDDDAGAATGDNAPPTHTVRRGDTLWDISQQYFRDPWRWPKIWALNPEITNPHWIFPGQSVRLRDAGGSAAMVKIAAAGDVAPVAEAPLGAVGISRPRAAGAVGGVPQLRQIGFVDEGALKSSGVINGSLEEKIMLATGDHAYVEFPDGAPAAPKPGSPALRYSVYRVDTDNPIRSPGSNAVLGYLVHVYGEVVLEGAPERTVANGRLVDLAEPVERGYRVGPLLPDMRQVAPKTNAVSLTGRVIAAMDPGSLISTQEFVVVNRGRRHGVEVGNRFLVQRQGDGLKRMLESWDTSDPRFPPHTIAEILAVDVRDETTVGWIARGERELRVGDVADLQRGY